uniref:Uncharacterized protein n=1 Tax=Ananas comosus var. bracteatus TaxID=296719 RepID=A0A6V7P9E8_ANACO|nr:unnamed protein product [Ananas comosus var. bracteatus]
MVTRAAPPPSPPPSPPPTPAALIDGNKGDATTSSFVSTFASTSAGTGEGEGELGRVRVRVERTEAMSAMRDQSFDIGICKVQDFSVEYQYQGDEYRYPSGIPELMLSSCANLMLSTGTDLLSTGIELGYRYCIGRVPVPCVRACGLRGRVPGEFTLVLGCQDCFTVVCRLFRTVGCRRETFVNSVGSRPRMPLRNEVSAGWVRLGSPCEVGSVVVSDVFLYPQDFSTRYSRGGVRCSLDRRDGRITIPSEFSPPATLGWCTGSF